MENTKTLEPTYAEFIAMPTNMATIARLSTVAQGLYDIDHPHHLFYSLVVGSLKSYLKEPAIIRRAIRQVTTKYLLELDLEIRAMGYTNNIIVPPHLVPSSNS